MNPATESGRPRESGQTMAEYGVVLTVITAGIVTTIGVLGGTIAGWLERAAEIVGFAL